MEYCAYAIGAAVALYALGLGFTLWLLPPQLQRYALILSPGVGYCYCVIGCWHLYRFGAKIDQRTALSLLILPVVSLLLVCFKDPAALRRVVSSRSVFAALFVAATAFFVVSIPLFWGVRGLTTISLFGHDPAQYAAVA